QQDSTTKRLDDLGRRPFPELLDGQLGDFQVELGPEPIGLGPLGVDPLLAEQFVILGGIQQGEPVAALDDRAVWDDPKECRGTAHDHPATPSPDPPILELALDDGALRTLDPAAGDHPWEQVGPAHARDRITLAWWLSFLSARPPKSQPS